MKHKVQLMVCSILGPHRFGIVLFASPNTTKNQILSWFKMISTRKPDFTETALLHANKACDTL